MYLGRPLGGLVALAARYWAQSISQRHEEATKAGHVVRLVAMSSAGVHHHHLARDRMLPHHSSDLLAHSDGQSSHRAEFPHAGLLLSSLQGAVGLDRLAVRTFLLLLRAQICLACRCLRIGMQRQMHAMHRFSACDAGIDRSSA